MALAAFRPSFARLRMRCRSSSAIALRRAIKPRPSGVVRSRCGLSSTLIRAPRALMRSIRWMPSNIDLVARSHSATTRQSPFAELVDCFFKLGSILDALARGLLAEDDVDPFGADFPHLVSILK